MKNSALLEVVSGALVTKTGDAARLLHRPEHRVHGREAAVRTESGALVQPPGEADEQAPPVEASVEAANADATDQPEMIYIEEGFVS